MACTQNWHCSSAARDGVNCPLLSSSDLGLELDILGPMPEGFICLMDCGIEGSSSLVHPKP